MNWFEFVAESNRIEGIVRPPTEKELSITQFFVTGAKPTIESLSELAKVYAGERAQLRIRDDMNVRVGNYYPPRGGPHIRAKLQNLLERIEDSDPQSFHVQYESLHPFIDGNGRTGRALWAWQMYRQQPEMLDLNFLHAFYYQTLAAAKNGKQSR